MGAGWLDTPLSLTGKCIWVAGHNGLVGSALLRRLERESCEVLTVGRDDLDLCRQADVERWVEAQKPDIIVIAAAKVGGIGANSAHPAQFYYENTMIATNIMHSAYLAGIERLLFLGSSCIYPRDCTQPIEESALLSGTLEPTNEAYALAKIGGLKMAQYYRKEYGCDFISAMPCNLYGVGDYYDAYNSHVIPALMMKAHKAKVQQDQALSVWGSGMPLREFLYVDDLADALVVLLQRYSGAGHVNIGSGQEIEIKNLIQGVCDVVEYKGKIVFDESKPDGAPRKILDSSQLFETGWKPEIDLNTGIRKCYNDYLRRFGNEKGENNGSKPYKRAP
ncbi:MAG: GDP-fucose synthetase [Zetaproteobacteria bacterium]|nr:MAG: GDP-fucose synthetase [Zetaproteobacteria bacterium]